MKTVRQYVVDHHLPGCLPDRAEPAPTFTSEEDAITVFKDDVKDALTEVLHEAAVNGDISAARLVEINQELDAITIGLVLGLKVGEELSIMVGNYRYYLGRIEDAGIPEQTMPKMPDTKTLVDRKKVLLDELVQAIQNLNIDRARDIMHQIDNLPHATMVRQAKIDMIAGMFQYIRDNWLIPFDDLGPRELGHRNGYLHAILVAAGVPYAVAGEMRPSREWQSTFETVKLIALDTEQNAFASAEWLIDLPKGQAADPDQPDFAEQVRPAATVESFATGGETRTQAGEFLMDREPGVGETTIEN